jgi:hypothetical protein
MMQAWNFDQPEARAAFEQAAAADPGASMPLWGMAYALGPGANRRGALARLSPGLLGARQILAEARRLWPTG